MTDLLTFIDLLRSAFCRETSELPELWSEDNRSIGQCHTASLAIQQFFGGDIIEGVVTSEDGMFIHYWVEIEGVTIDATADQFWGRTNTSGGILAEPPLQITRDKADLLLSLALIGEIRDAVWDEDEQAIA